MPTGGGEGMRKLPLRWEVGKVGGERGVLLVQGDLSFSLVKHVPHQA